MTYDRDEIAKLPLSKLAALFNELTGQEVKKFASREAGLRRVYAALDAREAEAPAAAPEPAPAAEEPAPKGKPTASKLSKPSRAEEPSKASKARRGPAAKPAQERARRTAFEPGGELRPPRPGSKRGRLLAALQGRGMTAEQIAAEFEWKARDVSDALRLLATANGYAVHLDEDGKTWRAAEPK